MEAFLGGSWDLVAYILTYAWANTHIYIYIYVYVRIQGLLWEHT